MNFAFRARAWYRASALGNHKAIGAFTNPGREPMFRPRNRIRESSTIESEEQDPLPVPVGPVDPYDGP